MSASTIACACACRIDTAFQCKVYIAQHPAKHVSFFFFRLLAVLRLLGPFLRIRCATLLDVLQLLSVGA